MTKFRIFILTLAALAALILAGCGDTTQESSVPEGLATFGTQIDPSAQPSTGEVVPGTSGDPAVKVPGTTGNIGDENNAQTSGSPTTSTTPTYVPTATPKPIVSSNPAPAPSESEPPVISPPAPVSTATADQAREYIGQPLDNLISALGYASSNEYELIDEDDPSAGEIGTLYFDGFTVTTKRTADGEIITAVN